MKPLFRGEKMKVINLGDHQKELYFCCLEDWSDEMKEAGDHKEIWYEKMKDKGLRVKLSADDEGKIGGMIQYIPIEHSFAEGKDLYFVLCIWVHGYKKGRGNFRKKGMGKALLQAVEADVKDIGAKGLVVWGVPLPVFMRASWFKKQGYTVVDKQGFLGQVLLWKPFVDDAVPPKWIAEKKRPEPASGKVTVTVLNNGWCPAQNIVFERAKRAASEFGEKVEFQEIDTFDREVLLEWGAADVLYINDKPMRTGPPPPYKKIKKRIARNVKKL